MTTRLYALGSNSSGQLGIGHHEDVDVPTPCHFIRIPMSCAKISNTDLNGNDVDFKRSCDLKSNVRKIVAGGNHTIVLCDNGAVYAAGNREALGEAIDLGSQNPGPDESSSCDLSSYFTRVMWWEDSQMLDTFTDVSASWSASFFVVAPQIQNGFVVRFGQIYVCGKGEKGELGLGENVVETAKPRRVAVFGSKDYPLYTSIDPDEVPLIPGILAGIWSSVAYTVTCSTDEVHIFGWGSCRKGQLGGSAREKKVLWKPTKIADEDIKQDIEIDRIFMAAVGKDFTLLLGTHGKQDNRVRKWRLLGGNSIVKNDGDDARKFLADLSIPIPTGEIAWLRTTPFAGWSNVYVLESRTQKVKALGRNDRGQLPPEELPGVSTMAAGSEHCVCLTSQGKAVAWGWGEHGNCGRKSDETGQGWSTLDLPSAGAERITGVGAGCATTFIWTTER